VWDWLRRFFPATRFAQSVTVLAGGTVLAQALVVASSPILTRLYEPEAFGVLAVYSSILSVLLVFGTMRYELAVPLPEDDNVAACLVILAFAILTLVAATAEVGLWAFGDQLATWLNGGALRPYLWLLPVGLLGEGAFQTLSYWAMRKGHFGELARAKIVQVAAMVAVQIGTATFGVGTVGLMVGDTVGRLAGGGMLVIVLGVGGSVALLKRTPMQSVVNVARRYAKFPLVTSWASLLNVVSLQAPIVLLSAFFGIRVAGFYSLAYRVLGLPSAVLGQAAGQVFLTRAAQARRQPERLAALTKGVSLALLGIGLPVFGVIMIAGKELFVLVFGQEWAIAGEHAQVLSLWFMLWLVSSPLSSLLLVREWQGLSLALTVFQLSLRMVAIWLGARMGSSGVAVVLLGAAGVVIALVEFRWFFRAARLPVRDVAGGAARLFGVCAAAMIPVALASATGRLLVVLPAITVSMAGYFWLVLRTGSLLGLAPHQVSTPHGKSST